MSQKTDKLKVKRLPKGLRIHVRKLKREARIEGIIYKPERQGS